MNTGFIYAVTNDPTISEPILSSVLGVRYLRMAELDLFLSEVSYEISANEKIVPRSYLISLVRN